MEKVVSELDLLIGITQSQKQFYLSLEIKGCRCRIRPGSIMEYSSTPYSLLGTDNYEGSLTEPSLYFNQKNIKK